MRILTEKWPRPPERPVPIALVAPTTAAAIKGRLAVARRLPGSRLVPISLAGFARDPRAPLEIVLLPAGETVDEDIRFLRDARRRVLWPPPAAETWSAIAGLRGSHDSPPPSSPTASRRSERRSALLLEGDVMLARARRAASSGAPRDWIVERVQRVRIAPPGLDELRRLGIRWAVLEPVRVVGLACSASLARRRRSWARFFPEDVAVWTLGPSSDFRSR